ncbi:hypothetical protein CDAR_120751 [Caerostris darwini]|uniref:Uncharacterized protein n=1 Tax=Caerostris darwini TaxID=1538125 RepID=A0AAV4RT67_9ARAC|nr:hypothetical protein CDAR_120751 [Caerostris darwini]
MHRLVAFSAALSNYPPLTTTSLNPRLNCFHPHPTPSGRLISCPAPANPGQTNANLLPLKLHSLCLGSKRGGAYLNESPKLG